MKMTNRDSKGRMVSRPLKVRLKEQLDKIDRTQKCWMWKGACGGRGYPVIRDSDNRQTRVSHIMIKEARPSDKHVCCHKCDTPKCVRPSHLFWGTCKENMQDASKKGRMNKPTGEHLEKIRKAAKALWKDPIWRAQKLKSLTPYGFTKFPN